MPRHFISIIIPALHEAGRINRLIGYLRSIERGTSAEIIVIDGAPEHDTIEALNDSDVRLLSAEKGRASQMNAGARAASGEVLLFLHADTLIPENGLILIENALADGRHAAGAFKLAFDSRNSVLQCVAWLTNFRTFITGVPYGDQAIFVRRQSFERVGGYPEVPILEDVQLSQKLKKTEGRLVLLKQSVHTSARRWKKEGLVRRSLKNRLIIILYQLGVPPEKLVHLHS